MKHAVASSIKSQPVHLLARKSYFSRDLEFKGDTPIFCTTKHDIVYVRGGVIDERETEMMAVRWHSFQFQRQIREREQLTVPSCAKCFAEFILHR